MRRAAGAGEPACAGSPGLGGTHAVNREAQREPNQAVLAPYV